jgi:hypothetical protein
VTTRVCRFLLVLLLIAGVSKSAQGQSKTIDDGPQEPIQKYSLGQALNNPDNHAVHIIYIHGVAAENAGGSWNFQRHLCRFLSGCKLGKRLVPTGKRDFVEDGVFANPDPPDLKYLGKKVWNGPDEWKHSKPFVDHYILPRHGGQVVVDEINWWPLVLPLKCGKIMEGEAYLAGPDKDLLNLCSGRVKPDKWYGPEPFAWISTDEADTLKSQQARGARFNREVKNNLMDWGFADPMMAVGPMGDLFREAMRQLFVDSARFNADATTSNDGQRPLKGNARDREFVVVSHSLGSFLVFYTLGDPSFNAQECVTPKNGSSQPQGGAAEANAQAEKPAACHILARTSIVYFLANQVPLLQLATLTEDLNRQLEIWRNLRGDTHITAFSDPSDLLSWHFPKVSFTDVQNCEVRNTFWHWLIAPPTGAHVNYSQNKAVLRIMMHPEIYGAQSCAAPQ